MSVSAQNGGPADVGLPAARLEWAWWTESKGDDRAPRALAEALGQVATTPDAARRFLDSVDDADAAFARERLLALRAALGVADDEVAPEETVEPPDDVEEGEKLKKRAERLEAARTRAASSVRKHLKALLVPAARGDAGKVD